MRVTIAACYLSTGAVILGADSTTTIQVNNLTQTAGTARHFNYGQKIFEVGHSELGRPGDVAVLTWGLATLQNVSYRSLIARLADLIAATSPSSLMEVAQLWRDGFNVTYQEDAAVQYAQLLEAQAVRSPDEQKMLTDLGDGLQGGFCVAGSLPADRTPAAAEITFHPTAGVSAPVPIPVGPAKFWGVPSIMRRLVYGMDDRIFEDIVASGRWTADRQALIDLVRPHILGQAINLPLREAIDFVYTSIYTTIKALKFSHYPPVCGGPIEIAAITSDRPFRWIRHKRLPEAILFA